LRPPSTGRGESSPRDASQRGASGGGPRCWTISRMVGLDSAILLRCEETESLHASPSAPARRRIARPRALPCALKHTVRDQPARGSAPWASVRDVVDVKIPVLVDPAAELGRTASDGVVLARPRRQRT
jgi:hypothetical protein